MQVDDSLLSLDGDSRGARPAPEYATGRGRVRSPVCMMQRCFVYGGRAVRVACADASHLTWLEEFLAPAFAVADDCAAECVVELVIDDAHYAALLATRPPATLPVAVCFVLDQGALSAPWWAPKAGTRNVQYEEHRVVYIVATDGSHVRIVSHTTNAAVRHALMRVVRERAMSAAWTRTSLVLHAAAIAAGGRGIIIAGRKHAGKTSLLIHCMHAPGVQFVSNDRVVMDLSGSTPLARGMPTIVSVREGTLQLFPTLSARLHRREFHSRRTLAEVERVPVCGDPRRSASLSQAQLCHLLGVPMAGEVGADVLLLPRVDTAVEGLALRPLTPDEANARLADVLFASNAATRTSEVFRVGAPDTEPATLERLWRTAMTHMRAYECILGEGAFQPERAAEFIDRVCAARLNG